MKENDLPRKVKKADRFFAFYRNKGFYQLWLLFFILSTFILSGLDVPILLIEFGAIIVSIIASFLIFGVIIMTTDIPEGKSHCMNSRNSSGVSSPSSKEWSWDPIMRMLKRNIRRRWLQFKQLTLRTSYLNSKPGGLLLLMGT